MVTRAGGKRECAVSVEWIEFPFGMIKFWRRMVVRVTQQ